MIAKTVIRVLMSIYTWRKSDTLPIRLLVGEADHQILFLPKYSPDLNDIEHDFSALKRAIMYSHSATSLDEIIRAYCAT